MPFATNAARPLPEDVIAHYVIDANRSSFQVQAFATGLLSSFGHNPRIAARQFQGDVSFTVSGGTLEDAKLELKIQADSLTVIDDISEKDRQDIERQMYENVLETAEFPQILYEWSASQVKGNGELLWLKLDGALTLHGETHTVPVSARVVIDGDTLRVSGDFTVQQSDYNITIVKVAGGAIKLKDEVKGKFDMVAHRQG